ncbi:MAG: anti-sigma factor, partial [Chloroflexi bacterium]|nr:anti-sigma factor [Chloroflexota bacterium]
MNCQEVRELLPLYLDGELENYQKESVSRHLDGCPECRRRLELDRRLTGSLARLARPTVAARVPATLKPRVMAKVGNRQRWQPFWRAARVLASGTTLVIWIGLVGLLLVAIATMARDMPGIAAKPPLAPQTTGVAAPSPAAATAAAARAPVALLSLKMVDTTTGWAVSNRAILRITDGSSHWTSVTPPAILLRSYAPPSGEAFAGQYFLDASTGMPP